MLTFHLEVNQQSCHTSRHHTAIKLLKVFKFLVYSELTSGRTICSHSIMRITSGGAICLAIAHLSCH